MIETKKELSKEEIQEEEDKFEEMMESIGMKILDVGGDGNCLFRSIAHQAYGDEEQHRMVRIRCMQYILTEKDYFSSFIEGGAAKVEEYV